LSFLGRPRQHRPVGALQAREGLHKARATVQALA
jgi:hypothetical protein